MGICQNNVIYRRYKTILKWKGRNNELYIFEKLKSRYNRDQIQLIYYYRGTSEYIRSFKRKYFSDLHRRFQENEVSLIYNCFSDVVCRGSEMYWFQSSSSTIQAWVIIIYIPAFLLLTFQKCLQNLSPTEKCHQHWCHLFLKS